MSDNDYYRDASQRLVFGMFRFPADDYFDACDALAGEFDLMPSNPLISDGLALVFRDYRRGEQIVGLEWDNWSGFIVVAKTPESEPLVHEIGTWLLQSPWASASDPADG